MSSSSQIVWILALGLVAGVLSGMFGIGGGLVIVPASRSCTYSRRAWSAASFAIFGRRARRSACH